MEHDFRGPRLYETGTFIPTATGTPLGIRNVYQWVDHGSHLALWHERFGRDAAVRLFDLIATGAAELAAAEPHRCGEDRYDARLMLVDDGFDLTWSITGPNKDDTLAYRYRSR